MLNVTVRSDSEPAGETVFYLVQAVDECSPPNESALSDHARPVCSFSGWVQILDPVRNEQLFGMHNVQVHVSSYSAEASLVS